MDPVLGTLQGLLERSTYAAVMPKRIDLLFTVERRAPVGMRVVKFPDTFQQNVPGYTIFGIFCVVSLLGSSFLREKREGTFRRLLAAPIARATLLAGKLVAYYLINLLQIAIMLGAARLLFGMSLGSSPVGLVAVSLAAAATAIRTAGLVALHAWALGAYQDVLVRGYGFREVLPKVGALAGFAGAFFSFGIWRFSFE
ncbi:MAG: ABC transporter permease [Armatimonadota bacterium]|nr:ABC transporter permease [Armatimonadota bacterium]MDR7426714.1 ABC transporter permease [Armatimonadota bacterium]MDR7463742.1 ABC transporter permease [Armatimonadota bacterium]MDR7469265.1 ABC transporter permease [Armatimonadota bacterium]MDR7475115.1 ABC transporter permease [Armatimonadota bacterium]